MAPLTAADIDFIDTPPQPPCTIEPVGDCGVKTTTVSFCFFFSPVCVAVAVCFVDARHWLDMIGCAECDGFAAFCAASKLQK